MTPADTAQTKPTTTQRAKTAHHHTTTVTNAGIAASLQDVLGQKLAAHIAGLADVKAIGEYAKGSREPRLDVEERLRLAYQVFQIIVDSDSDHVARAWFIGLNPQLNDDTPADAIREGRYKDVLAAARAYINS
jgi:hypothetical protein